MTDKKKKVVIPGINTKEHFLAEYKKRLEKAYEEYNSAKEESEKKAALAELIHCTTMIEYLEIPGEE